MPKRAVVLLALFSCGFVLTVTYSLYRISALILVSCVSDRPLILASPPPSEAWSFAFDPDPVSGVRYSGAITFSYSVIGMGGSSFALTIRNTGTQTLPLRKEDFTFIGGSGRPDGTIRGIEQEVTPWHDTVPPGGTIRNEFTLTRINRSNSAVGVEWHMGRNENGISLPVADTEKQARINQEDAC